jgi:preprotein translocase subunit SecA
MAAMIEQAGQVNGKLVETAQRQVEQRDYKSRKRVLDFDDVMNLQREIIYGYRNDVLTTEDTRKLVHDLIRETIPARIHEHLTDNDPDHPDLGGLVRELRTIFPLGLIAEDLTDKQEETITSMIVENLIETYNSRAVALPMDLVESEERRIILVSIDKHWQEHLDAMEALREGVFLRAQGQKDPLVEYKNEAYELFVNLMDAIKQEAMPNLFRSIDRLDTFITHVQGSAPIESALRFPLPPPPSGDGPGRNAPCICGSGRKFKQCCGRMK